MAGQTNYSASKAGLIGFTILPLVPYDGFAQSIEVWNREGRVVATVADLPVADEVPRQGVRTGPRGIEWQPLQFLF